MLSARKVLFVTTVLFLISFACKAEHIFGGSIVLKTEDVEKRKYLLKVNLYVDVPRLKGLLSEIQNNAFKVSIFSKKENKFVEFFQVPYRSQKDVVFQNNACATQRNLKILYIAMDYEINLDPTKYTDPEGYYMVLDYCCRNLDLDNIKDPGNTATLFYTEIPALFQNNQVIDYSSPEFGILNGDFICLNRLFKYKFAATDADGDELKYKMGVPLQGISTLYQAVQDAVAGPYKSVNWEAGYSSASPITGNPGLTIDGLTGVMSIKANKVGLYLFSVVVEDYRNGKYMGKVVHDFQLPVVQCSFTTPPVPVVKYNGALTPSLEVCPGQSVLLETANDPSWAFQWQKNGLNIEGAVSNTYLATEKADYQVIKSLKGLCVNDTVSNTVALKSATAIPKIKANSLNICGTNSLAINVDNPLSTLAYVWTFGGTNIGSGTSISVDKPGYYYLQSDKPTGNCKSDADSVLITKTLNTPLPEPKSSYEACTGETIKLETLASAGYTYQWRKDNVIISNETKKELNVTNDGNYDVIVKDNNNCEGTSKKYVVKISSQPTINISSLGPLCMMKNNIGILYAQPTGGVFSGPGIIAGAKNNEFDPIKAGIGKHSVLYDYSSPSGCKGQAKIEVEVTKGFDLQVLPPNASVEPGDSVEVKLVSNLFNVYVHWHPDKFLLDHNALNQVIKPTENIEYTIVAVSPDGCKYSTTANITVLNFANLSYPSSFSPNGDSKNDEFKFFGDSFKTFSLKIFNRWGEQVFESTDKDYQWNGGLHNDLSKPLPQGTYVFTIEVENDKGFTRKNSGNINLLK